MISDESRASVDALSEEELILELNKGRTSRFQNDTFAYLKTRLDLLRNSEQRSQSEREHELASEANRIARGANDIAEQAHRTSIMAYRMAAISVVVSLVAALIAFLAK